MEQALSQPDLSFCFSPNVRGGVEHCLSQIMYLESGLVRIWLRFIKVFDLQGDKCGCLDSSGFKTQLVNRRNCSLVCSGSLSQQCGGPPTDAQLQTYYATQVQGQPYNYFYFSSCMTLCALLYVIGLFF